LDAGDAAVTVEFGLSIARDTVARVVAYDAAIRAAIGRHELPGVVETMPTFRSLTVCFDPLRTDRGALDVQLLALATPLLRPGAGPLPEAADTALWRLPVCYGGDHGADLEAVAAATGLTPGAVAEQHAGTEFTVYMIGFMPGFPFMGDLPAVLNVPRLREPRVRVPAGSVAITTGLSSIYPWESPGGWQLIGRCPIPLFDAAAPRPSLLAAGDRVRFEPVSAARHAELAAAVAAGELRPASLRQADPAPGAR
jgi:KipI family sensor histidine kinase inhibitor